MRDAVRARDEGSPRLREDAGIRLEFPVGLPPAANGSGVRRAEACPLVGGRGQAVSPEAADGAPRHGRPPRTKRVVSPRPFWYIIRLHPPQPPSEGASRSRFRPTRGQAEEVGSMGLRPGGRGLNDVALTPPFLLGARPSGQRVVSDDRRERDERLRERGEERPPTGPRTDPRRGVAEQPLIQDGGLPLTVQRGTAPSPSLRLPQGPPPGDPTLDAPRPRPTLRAAPPFSR